jgi:RND family efflux transporter MFP subunit
MVLAIIGLVSITAVRALEEEEEGPAIPPGEMQARVRIETVHEGELPVQLHAIGTLVPRRQNPTSVVALTDGVVTSVEVRDGQMVNSGTVLVRLDARSAKNALAKAQAALRGAEADLNKAMKGGLESEQATLDVAAAQAEMVERQTRKESERQAALLAEDLTSEKAATIARQTWEEAQRAARAARDKAGYYRQSGRSSELARVQAAVEQARAEVRAAQLDMGGAVVRAPQRGRVSRLDASVGRVVAAGSVVAQVMGTSASALLVHLAPADADRVRIGAPVAIRNSHAAAIVPQATSATAASRPLAARPPISAGTVVSVGLELDPETGLVPVEVYLDAKAAPLRMGETMYTDIATSTPARGLLVPLSAVSFKDDAASVFTVDAKNIAHETPVQVLTRTADQAIVAGEGLADGMRVIVDGNYNLPDGAHVVDQSHVSSGKKGS